MFEEKNLKIPFHEKLNDLDSENQTFGCRANNPSICANNGLLNICAFTSEEGICKRPSKAWKKQYQKIKDEQ